MRLRAAIRAIHRDSFPGHVPLSDEECDLVIQKCGAVVARELIDRR